MKGNKIAFIFNFALGIYNHTKISIMPSLSLPQFNFNFKEVDGKRMLFDEIRKKYVTLTPEEWVRQNFVKYLVQVKHFPASLIALEMPLIINDNSQRSDIVIFNKQGSALMLVECKSPDVRLTQRVFDQAASYNLKVNAEILVITNGVFLHCCKPDYENRKWHFLEDIPDYKEMESICID